MMHPGDADAARSIGVSLYVLLQLATTDLYTFA
jgi:hypothetical protein